MSVKAIFLDLDGTLHDFEAVAARSMGRVYKKIGESRHRVPVAYLKQEYSKIRKMAKERGLGDGKCGRRQEERMFEALLACFGVKDRELVSEISDEYGTAYLEGVKPLEHAKRELQHLKKSYDLYIVSEGPEKTQKEVIKALGISPLIKDAYISGASKKGKRNGGLFRYALKKARLKPGEALVVGDSYENDIKGAQKAGIASVWLNKKRAYVPEEEPAHLTVIEEIGELGKALRKIVDGRKL